MASGSRDKTIGMWRVSSGERIKTLIRHSSDVNSVAFSPNGDYLASGSRDKTIGVWRVSSGERIITLTGHSDSIYSVVFSPNGEYLASASGRSLSSFEFDYQNIDNTIKVWSLEF